MPLPDDYWLPNGLAKHSDNRPGGLIETEVVIDVGSGVRPMAWFKPERHICIEPYGSYCERLFQTGLYEVVEARAEEGLKGRKADTVFFLDALHHMDKDEGKKALSLAVDVARVQVVVREPLNFEEDDEDVWEMGGEYWQTHRSHWPPSEFDGWLIERSGKGFFAIWNV